LALIEKHIPQEDRLGFYFHAKDIYHGARYFDRRKPEWASEEKRHSILCELAAIIDDLTLPIVWGQYQKDKFGLELLASVPEKTKHALIHAIAATDCLTRADGWLEKYSPAELAAVIHEDGSASKKLIKYNVRILRDNDLMKAWGYTEEIEAELHLPSNRIIDTVHFAEKADAHPLQLADLCAFGMARLLKEKPLPAYIGHVLSKHMAWINLFARSFR